MALATLLALHAQTGPGQMAKARRLLFFPPSMFVGTTRLKICSRKCIFSRAKPTDKPTDRPYVWETFNIQFLEVSLFWKETLSLRTQTRRRTSEAKHIAEAAADAPTPILLISLLVVVLLRVLVFLSCCCNCGCLVVCLLQVPSEVPSATAASHLPPRPQVAQFPPRNHPWAPLRASPQAPRAAQPAQPAQLAPQLAPLTWFRTPQATAAPTTLHRTAAQLRPGAQSSRCLTWTISSWKSISVP